jgi:hypothetical protein
MMIFLLGADVAGLEKTMRLFPIRTSMSVPDWVIMGRWADQVGAGDVVGAG